MSVDASIKIHLSRVDNMHSETMKIIQALLNSGWTLGRNGHLFYLPLGDRGSYDWQTKLMNTEEFSVLVKSKETLGETVGIEMIWKTTGIGASFLFWPKDIYETFTMNLDAERPLIMLNANYAITDFQWYLEKLLPPLNDAFGVEYFSCEQHR